MSVLKDLSYKIGVCLRKHSGPTVLLVSIRTRAGKSSTPLTAKTFYSYFEAKKTQTLFGLLTGNVLKITFLHHSTALLSSEYRNRKYMYICTSCNGVTISASSAPHGTGYLKM
jgi:hypothetical protein